MADEFSNDEGPASPRVPEPICPSCNGTGRIYRAGSGGPRRILVLCHCDECGHDWEFVWHPDGDAS